jgi:hypothetical protein
MSVWPYTTRQWERVRQQKMARDPLCEACLQVGEIVPAEVVDHRIPITKEGREKRSAAEAFPHLDGLASLCANHHTRKRARNSLGRKIGCARAAMCSAGRSIPITRGTESAIVTGLSDNQLRAVMTAAGALPPVMRPRFLELMAVHLRGVHYPRDDELGNAMRLALQTIERDIGDAA